MRRRPFTMIEILVVIAIIGILAALAFTVYPSVVSNSRKKRTISQIASLELALQQYKDDYGYYPLNGAGEPVLLDSSEASFWTTLQDPGGAPYLPDIERNFVQDGNIYLDGWSRPLAYCAPGKKNPKRFDLWSYGADGEPGVAGEDDDSDGGDDDKPDESYGTSESDDIANWLRN